MRHYIRHHEGDDASFISALDLFVADTAKSRMPTDLFVVRVDNWFDHKWLGFAGKGKVAIETGIESIDSEMRGFWKSGHDVTIPPFTPKRIIEEMHFTNEEGSLVHQDTRSIHPLSRKRASANLRNRAIDHSPNDLFIWFSSQSAISLKASMLLYHTRQGDSRGWYASFHKTDTWKVDRTKNMDRELFDRIFSTRLKNST